MSSPHAPSILIWNHRGLRKRLNGH
jgi:hypothetical protein